MHEEFNRDAARSLFCGRNKRFHITGFSFACGKRVCFHRGKLTFFPWWYMLALGKKTQDLLNKCFSWPKETFSRQKVSFWGQGKPFGLSGTGKRMFQTPKPKTNSNRASFKTLKTNIFSASLVSKFGVKRLIETRGSEFVSTPENKLGDKTVVSGCFLGNKPFLLAGTTFAFHPRINLNFLRLFPSKKL